ncbi:ABC transporter ATP-binding protein [Lachnospiraceae bacterium MD1]|uniref:ABC transporter ATP-binding protein n=1 Tax=Variimorphobacter saccharofermentans TaxID=2755051 RepID=A0A839K7V0_9FIRM|nr:ATP-binding cassette domain-containing protein [Variimorphobacter saccharofermentans]MBB2184721.1 ABC transporter ATP-binding protein [Variimorphobacter saccharofermentans]
MEDIIQVNHLKRYFKDIKAVDDISFKVKKGQLYGFLGVNGAGKSTTINMLCTLLPRQEGEVTICGHRLGKKDREIRSKIGVVFQDNTLDNRLTIKENLVIRAGLYHNNNKEIMANLDYVCDVLGIGDLLKRQFNKLSGGQKRRCEIARALMNRPELLFLDEPTTGLDPQTRQSVWSSIEALQKEVGMTVFLTTHYMEEAAKAQYISIMEAGKLVANGTPFELKEKYAHDILKLVPQDFDELAKVLNEQNISSEKRTNHIRVIIQDSLHGLEILNRVKEYLKSYEVIQGTMDDVFLNITGKSL